MSAMTKQVQLGRNAHSHECRVELDASLNGDKLIIGHAVEKCGRGVLSNRLGSLRQSQLPPRLKGARLSRMPRSRCGRYTSCSSDLRESSSVRFQTSRATTDVARIRPTGNRTRRELSSEHVFNSLVAVDAIISGWLAARILGHH